MLCLVLTIFSCNTEQLPNQPAASQAAEPFPAEEKVRPPKVEQLEFDLSEFEKTELIKGKVVEGMRWQDTEGKHLLLISEIQRGIPAFEDHVSAIFARSFLQMPDSFQLEWEIQEYADCCSDVVHYQKASLKLSDLNENGYGESIFGYHTATGGEDAEIAKMMLHVEDKKYAVRGQFAGSSDDKGKVEKMKFDPSYDQLPDTFRHYAQTEWQAFQTAYYDSWK